MDLLKFLAAGALLLLLLAICAGTIGVIGYLSWRTCKAIVWRVRIHNWNTSIRKNRARYPDIVRLERIGAITEDDAIDTMISRGRDKVRGRVGVHYPSRFDFKIVRSPAELVNAMRRVHDRAADEARLRKRLPGFMAKST